MSKQMTFPGAALAGLIALHTAAFAQPAADRELLLLSTASNIGEVDPCG